MKTKITQVILNDLFPDWLTGGGFISILTENTDVPWKETVDGDILDLEYHGNRSGTKIIAPLLGRMIVDNEISDSDKSRLAVLAFLRFGQNWGKLWDTLSLEYNPIENYDLNESETNNITASSTFNETTGIYGFDSEDAVDNGTRNGGNSGTQGSIRGLRRHGNIGVTTSQQMIQSERDLWVWQFFDTVFADIDSLIVTGAFGYRCGELSLDVVPYRLPVAGENRLGGVKANDKTEEDTTPVRIDADGYLWIASESGLPPYTEENENDFLRIINNVPAWNTVPNAGGELF